MFKMKIRNATWEDKEFVKKLDEENMKEIIESYNKKYSQVMYDSFNPNKCFIIEEDKPIGFAYFKTTKNKINIWSIQIVKNSQGKGYGRKLIEYITDFAKDKKLKKIILEVHINNKRAINFYEKFGFKNLGEVQKNKLGFEFEIR